MYRCRLFYFSWRAGGSGEARREVWIHFPVIIYPFYYIKNSAVFLGAFLIAAFLACWFFLFYLRWRFHKLTEYHTPPPPPPPRLATPKLDKLPPRYVPGISLKLH
jgi:hypothetical protein